MPDIAENFSKIAGRETPDTGMVVSNITESILIKKEKSL
jgi:hypothetical protein